MPPHFITCSGCHEQNLDNLGLGACVRNGIEQYTGVRYDDEYSVASGTKGDDIWHL